MTGASLRLYLLTSRRIRGCYVTKRQQRRLWIAYPCRWRKP